MCAQGIRCRHRFALGATSPLTGPPTRTKRGRPSASPEGSGKSRKERDQKSRKERDQNWTKGDIMALVKFKREEWLEDNLVEDARDLMHPETTKLGKIAHKLNSEPVAECRRDGHACKFKWGKMVQDYKKIFDHNRQTGTCA